MSYETILVEQRGAVTLVTLNRPQALNALNSQVLKDLIEHHAEEEEKEMFPKAKKAFSKEELQDLGERMMELKQELQKQY